MKGGDRLEAREVPLVPRKLCRPSAIKRGGFRFRDWIVVPFEGSWLDVRIDWQTELPKIWDSLESPVRIVKKDHRSEVALIEWQGRLLVLKKFLQQRNWWWFRLTSMLFPSLGEIACRNALLLNRLGNLTPPPALLMQRCRWGQVHDSWMFYPFIEDLPGSQLRIEQLTTFLRNMHRAGWIHGDSHPANFILSTAGIVTIDPIQARPWNLRYFQALDVVHLNDDVPGAMGSYGVEELGGWISVAVAGRCFLRIYRRAKFWLRRAAGFQRFNHR